MDDEKDAEDVESGEHSGQKTCKSIRVQTGIHKVSFLTAPAHYFWTSGFPYLQPLN